MCSSHWFHLVERTQSFFFKRGFLYNVDVVSNFCSLSKNVLNTICSAVTDVYFEDQKAVLPYISPLVVKKKYIIN